ncbi:ketopantoate reductase PanE/ApbA C terminal-domain-containing protein [Gongronella butleri]|nr:ketopantoate reductase PanE/ApbA C terminal-domain-containing protein [Gongronella butleri]
MQWHILGTGAIGCLLATHLRQAGHEAHLLLRSSQHLRRFDSSILYDTHGTSTRVQGVTASALDVRDDTPIANLIVATKAHHTAAALQQLAPRLSCGSAIFLLQNGMGVYEEVAGLWSDASKQPMMWTGVVRHAVERVAPFHIVHHSGWEDPMGGMMLGHRNDEKSEAADALAALPRMNAHILPWHELHRRMLNKLVVNACINPVATILQCKNGRLASAPGITLMNQICNEAHAVLADQFSDQTPETLAKMVIDTVHITATNTCSMRQDMLANVPTEIDYINGYLCNEAQKKGIDTPVNRTLVNLIHAQEAIFMQKKQ